jgi:hypothetical protein
MSLRGTFVLTKQSPGELENSVKEAGCLLSGLPLRHVRNRYARNNTWKEL